MQQRKSKPKFMFRGKPAFTIAEHNGRLLAYYENSQRLVETDDLQNLIDQLQLVVDESRNSRKSIYAIKMNMLCDFALNAICMGNWVFPNKRRDTWQSGKCVYFAVLDTHPNQIKIGMTQELSKRTGDIGRDNNGNVKIIAFLKTPHYQVVETFFHYSFAEAQVHGEWFDQAPVMEYLNRIQQLHNTMRPS